jgi:hypothetical protein
MNLKDIWTKDAKDAKVGAINDYRDIDINATSQELINRKALLSLKSQSS